MLSAINKPKEKIIDKYLIFDDNILCKETYEISLVKDTSKIRVKGRLKENSKYWHSIGCNKSILKVVEEGYVIPFLTTPEKQIFRNNQSALKYSDFVNEAVQELLDTDRIREMAVPPHVVNPLSVSTKGGKKRLILDLRYVNQNIYKEKIKFEDWKVVKEFLSPQGYMFKFDIKQGYHHIDISLEHQKFLGFSWFLKGKVRYFVFTVLPFGLSPAPFIFTKTMRVLIKFWRENLIKIAIFIDDGIGTDKNFEKAKQDAMFVKKSLKLSGFVVNEEKSVWIPEQKLTWLGISVDLTEMKKDTINDIITSLPYSTARKLSKLCGKIISMKIVMGAITQLKTRRLYSVIEQASSWDATLNLSNYSEAIQEIFFLKNNIFKYNEIPKMIVCSDASSTGMAAHVFRNNEQKIAYSQFLPQEKERSSTWRELKAIEYSL